MFGLKSKRVVCAEGERAASVWIEGERIARVGAYEEPGAEETPYVIMPGVVDTHVHVNEPGRADWEGFTTATRAAAAGGVTSIVDMPLNSIPATTSVEALFSKVEAMEGKCAIDVGLWGGAVPGNARALRDMVRAGALGFKCFLVESGVPEFGHVTLDELEEAMRSAGAPLLVHAELPGPIERARPTITDARSYLRYVQSRPRQAEDEAIDAVIARAQKTGARAHVVHLSSATALASLARAKDRGTRVSAETVPHYLALFAEAIPDGATAFKCAPPIRENQNRAELWRGLIEGVIGMVVTDHSPCTPELKQMDVGSFDAAWGGIASLQLGLSVVWTEARARGVDLATISRWMSSAPAELARLDQKGAIAPGKDADLVLFDPDTIFEVRPEMLLHKHKVTPYMGRALYGVVRRTYLRGAEIAGARGRWLRSAEAS